MSNYQDVIRSINEACRQNPKLEPLMRFRANIINQGVIDVEFTTQPPKTTEEGTESIQSGVTSKTDALAESQPKE